jgi:hypothetical protein
MMFRETKSALYKTPVRPILTYGHESMPIKGKVEKFASKL